MSQVVLLAEAAPLWTVFFGPLLGASVALFAVWLKRARGTYIEAAEVRSSSLVDIAPTVRERIKVFLDEEPVIQLGQIELRVINTGIDVLKDVRIVLEFPEATRVLDCHLNPANVASSTIPGPFRTIEINIPVINSYRLHKDEIFIKAVCDGPIRGWKVKGRGENWSVHKTSMNSIAMKYFKAISSVAIYSWVSSICLLAIALVLEAIDLPPNSPWRGFIPSVLTQTAMALLFGSLLMATYAVSRSETEGRQ